MQNMSYSHMSRVHPIRRSLASQCNTIPFAGRRPQETKKTILFLLRRPPVAGLCLCSPVAGLCPCSPVAGLCLSSSHCGVFVSSAFVGCIRPCLRRSASSLSDSLDKCCRSRFISSVCNWGSPFPVSVVGALFVGCNAVWPVHAAAVHAAVPSV